ncbi:beta-ketoacyl-ACP synthase 3 [Synechococcus sp. PCC 6312]|uniref:beta-ketoacyl-ACP synthase 3 n=1 Tax=Synechococcus sp. (strain ATCC 27167 / PCC 6312) TaxID=195253 RepID=UPI00029EF0F1|nr:beta-ketoacyl-ACP synthase 3 [Synechococcus sp. PCC 6312]AFY60439.1 3-oxoacyl-(acyl-carrier-protein) synthase III [Synechococcus sp. PCC 6312]
MDLPFGVNFIGIGAAAPPTSLSNHDLTALVETSDEWIRTRTGIENRRIATPDLTLTDLATTAAQAALTQADIDPASLDLVILATSTPDDLFGSASVIQARIGAAHAVAFDLTAACSGFIFGLVTASQYLQTGTYKRALVIGADILSRWVDWQDRRTCILFGDGAGAMIIEAAPTLENALLGFELRSDGRLNHHLTLAYQPKPQALAHTQIGQGTYHPIVMNGQEVYRFAVTQVPEVITKTLHRANLTAADIDWLVLHQANQRILDSVAQRLEIPKEKVISNLANYGNTSAASIPLALAESIEKGKIKPGHVIATAGFGAGLTWGAAIFRWGSDFTI